MQIAFDPQGVGLQGSVGGSYTRIEVIEICTIEKEIVGKLDGMKLKKI